MHRAFEAGGHVFEVIAGAPAERYGLRVSVSAGANPRRLADALGLSGHPLGCPAWVGLRVSNGGELRIKAYHRPDPNGEPWSLPKGFPSGLLPAMVSAEGDRTEHYLQLRAPCSWGRFVDACVAPLGGRPLAFAPTPRDVEGAFGVSVRRDAGRVTAVSLYADQRALPGDAAVRGAWVEGLGDADRFAYETALAAVRSVGPRRQGAWHALLAWTLEASGEWRRAASLRVPRAREVR